MTAIRRTPLALAIALTAVSAAAQTPQPPARAKGTVQAEATAILVDVVVRDKRGQPVMDLTPPDFDIYEDGVLQEVGALTRYMATPAGGTSAAAAAAPRAAAAAPPSAAPVEAPPEPVIALVFDRLTPEARVLARRAALRYVGEGTQSAARIAVFGIDLSLRPYQSYTRDAARLRQAITELGERSSAQFESQAGQAREAGDRADAAANGMAVLEAGGQAAAAAAQAGAGANAADAKFAQMQQRTLETFEMLERDQQGYSTSNGLMAVVNSLRALPGRKSVIFFSEGLAIPANVAARFRSVIDTANRANVSIYAMDAAGLRAESAIRDTADTINKAAQRNLGRNPTVDVVGKPMTEDLERNEDTLRHDPHSGLGQLSNETGGLLISNTNDLTGGFQRIDQDMRNYYMLSYVPKNDKFDGKFRTITVKVKRPGTEVAARKGYYAVRGAGPTPVLSYEARPLALLDSTPVPNAFPVRLAAIKFPDSARPGLTPVLVSAPAAAMTFVLSDDKSSYRAEFDIVVRVRNSSDEIVDKLSQSYVLTGPADRLEAVKQGSVLFFREPQLKPGVYNLEAIVYDTLSDRASVRFGTIEEPVVDPNAMRASDLVLVSSVERVAKGSQPAGNPFVVGDLLLYPNLGEPLRKSAAKELGFFFTAYPGKVAKPQAALELWQDGARLAALPLTLDAPDSSGRIQQMSRIPISSLAAGTYELRVVLTAGDQRLARAVTFRLEE